MKGISIYHLEDLLDTVIQNEAWINNKWVPARPLGLRTLWHRIYCAYLALTGKVDLVRWPENQ